MRGRDGAKLPTFRLTRARPTNDMTPPRRAEGALETDMDDLAVSLGYLLLGGVFVFAGVDHFMRFEAVSGMLAGRGWTSPRPILAAASVLQIVAGLGLALGPLRPWCALGLAAFTIVASLKLLDFWRVQGSQRDGMRSAFVVNVGLLGGLILAFGDSL